MSNQQNKFLRCGAKNNFSALVIFSCVVSMISPAFAATAPESLAKQGMVPTQSPSSVKSSASSGSVYAVNQFYNGGALSKPTPDVKIDGGAVKRDENGKIDLPGMKQPPKDVKPPVVEEKYEPTPMEKRVEENEKKIPQADGFPGKPKVNVAVQVKGIQPPIVSSAKEKKPSAPPVVLGPAKVDPQTQTKPDPKPYVGPQNPVPVKTEQAIKNKGGSGAGSKPGDQSEYWGGLANRDKDGNIITKV